jgi:hypothetical protein
MSHPRLSTALAALTAATAVTLAAAGAPPAAAAPPRTAAHQLTDLAHLDFLTASVAPPAQGGHTTYRLANDPNLGVLWVYANHESDGSFQRVGGGTFDPTTDTYGQGAYDADDISRAAVVYLKHWQLDGDAHSRDKAYQLLRGLTYLQTAAGPNAGNVVLWMQPDGTLNPSPTPKDSPDPSDSDASYWLARTIWALGTGYAAFRSSDRGFADFLHQRLDLAVAALDREVLTRYGHYQEVDGKRLPAWLITDGADASAEAVLGLSAFVRAGGDAPARTALRELAEGIAALQSGTPRTWPYGAVLPSATSLSMWHGWGAQMPAALVAAATASGRHDLLAPAVADAAEFTPHLLTATGPDNGWLPAPVDGSQIAYGADSRFESLLAVADASGSRGLYDAAGIAAGWFFGQNPAGVATYDPTTGVTDDGVGPDGTVNQNSGAESTIHGLLTMLGLDAHPDLIPLARASAQIVSRDGQHTVEAEAAQLSGPASVVSPASAWTGESQWSGGAYVHTAAGSRLTWTVPANPSAQLVQAVLNRVPGRAGASTFTDPTGNLGTARYGGGGAQGVSAAYGALLPVTIDGALPANQTSLAASTTGGAGDLDAVLLTPLVSRLVLAGNGHGTALLNSVATEARPATITLPGSGTAVASSYDSSGRPWRSARAGADPSTVTVVVPPGGFAIVRR